MVSSLDGLLKSRLCLWATATKALTRRIPRSTAMACSKANMISFFTKSCLSFGMRAKNPTQLTTLRRACRVSLSSSSSNATTLVIFLLGKKTQPRLEPAERRHRRRPRRHRSSQLGLRADTDHTAGAIRSACECYRTRRTFLCRGC